MQKKIIIIGAGPCGLGAAWRLNELGHDNWSLYEKNSHPGGLSASFEDSQGFWWDLGGHVLFSHYPYFDRVMDQVMDQETDWLFHDRSAWVWMEDRFIPYPIQNNIHRLPKEIFSECLFGLLDLQSQSAAPPSLTHFGEWINAGFGPGLAKYFLNPYNYKVWAYPVNELSHNWVGERVAKVDVKRIIENHIFDKDDISWGPNSRFRFPRYRGTGGIWENITRQLSQDKIALNCGVDHIDLEGKTIALTDGSQQNYDLLISTIPVTDLVEAMAPTGSEKKSQSSGHMNAAFYSQTAPLLKSNLKYSSTHVIGLALKGSPPEYLQNKCWLYFPENDNPFYRVTVFSNYSPNNVPDSANYWSLMCEVSESPMKAVNHEKVVEEVIQGALNTKLISGKQQIDHTWYKRMEKGYPTPSIKRNAATFPVLKKLEEQGIFSRGRFGGWRYEVGNMDHSFMQGVEAAGKALFGTEELTLWYPDVVNTPHPSTQF